jgi:non-heme chloroperoxidase
MEDAMNRRIALTAAAAAGVALATPSVAAPTRAATGRASVIETEDGARLFHRSWGEGPTLLFCAAWAFSSDAWQYQMLPLSEAGFRCVAFDRRGHGRSSDVGGGYDIDRLADDVARVMDALDLRGATLVGHSMGAGEAVRYLTRRGAGRVARLALIAPTTPCLGHRPDNPDGLPPEAFAAVRAAVAKDFPGWLGGAASQGFLTPDASPGLGDWIRGMMLRTSLQAAIACNRSFTEADFRPELKQLSVPTLILQGDADVSAPLSLTGAKTVALIPGARLEVYPGAPHGLIFTHAERLNRDLTAFARA